MQMITDINATVFNIKFQKLQFHFARANRTSQVIQIDLTTPYCPVNNLPDAIAFNHGDAMVFLTHVNIDALLDSKLPDG